MASNRNDVTRICQGCGREYTITQAELDEMLTRNIGMPVFCCHTCNVHGWDPQAVWFGKWRRARAEENGN